MCYNIKVLYTKTYFVKHLPCIACKKSSKFDLAAKYVIYHYIIINFNTSTSILAFTSEPEKKQ